MKIYTLTLYTTNRQCLFASNKCRTFRKNDYVYQATKEIQKVSKKSYHLIYHLIITQGKWKSITEVQPRPLNIQKLKTLSMSLLYGPKHIKHTKQHACHHSDLGPYVNMFSHKCIYQEITRVRKKQQINLPKWTK